MMELKLHLYCNRWPLMHTVLQDCLAEVVVLLGWWGCWSGGMLGWVGGVELLGPSVRSCHEAQNIWLQQKFDLNTINTLINHFFITFKFVVRIIQT